MCRFICEKIRVRVKVKNQPQVKSVIQEKVYFKHYHNEMFKGAIIYQISYVRFDVQFQVFLYEMFEYLKKPIVSVLRSYI